MPDVPRGHLVPKDRSLILLSTLCISAMLDKNDEIN